MTLQDSHPATVASAASPHYVNRAAEWLLGGPLSGALALTYLLMVAAWLPQYLSWPWWPDLDHFATFAMAWDAGVLPYRDLISFQFPGEYYLLWLVGKAFGWGKTAPIYAVDASLLVSLGVAMAVWSRARFGRSLAGIVGYGLFLCYYLSLGFDLVVQRDWHATLFAVLGLFAIEVIPGRAGRLTSTLALAAALTFRPHVLLVVPAYMMALDGSARPPGGPWRLTRRAVLEWAVMQVALLALAFAPLIASGLLDDFVRGLREAAPGGQYNRLTPGSLSTRMADQFGRNARFVFGAAAVALLVVRTVPARRREAATWIVALLGVWFYRPLAPIPHAYLAHPLTLIASVVAALLVQLILETPAWRPAVRLTLVSLVLIVGVPVWPKYVSPARSFHTLTAEKTFEFPRRPPVCGPSYIYSWGEYRATVFYLRRRATPGLRIANALRGLAAINGPVGRLPAFPDVSLAWFESIKNRPDLEALFVTSLKNTPESVVVWSPGEKAQEDSFIPKRILSYIESAYVVEARFGSIEVWRRSPSAAR